MGDDKKTTSPEKKPAPVEEPRVPTQVNIRLDDELQKAVTRDLLAREQLARTRITIADYLRGLLVDGLNSRRAAVK